ncbi:MAG: DUF4856 domain-containing protein [Thiothrix nivea]|nr:MAG: DUF4856 domain-containing protein [Thiothrix nivea]
MKRLQLAVAVGLAVFGMNVAMAETKVYADFPVTVKGYSGDKKTSVSYGGQMARHVLHTSLKKMAGQGDGKADDELKDKLMSYYSGKDKGRKIVAPASKEDFPLLQSEVDELSKGKNLAGKAYKGVVSGWPGHMTGEEVLAFMLEKAAATEKGYDPLTGYDYIQLFSKTAMGAVFYNQAVDNYLDELLGADKKPNDKPYSEGAAYTGKEHVWDEAFGYFGAPAHTLTLDAETAYNIAKGKKDALKAADANGDGKIDLYTEMTYAHAYYAAGADKGGKTNYLHNITQAFVDGRQLIADAGGKKLTDKQRSQLQAYAADIRSNWEKVIAEAAFKYAGSVYKDLKKIQSTVESNGDIKPVYRDYAKHWGELKGFALALQMGGKDLGETAVKLNRLLGFSPVSLSNEQVTGLDADGNYVMSKTIDMGEYMIHMAKLQTLLGEAFDLKALKNAITDDIQALSKKLGVKKSAEND